MSSGRLQLLPKRHHMTRAEAMAYLGAQVFRDALASGPEWLAATVKRPGRNGTVFFRAADVEMVSMKVAAGEYPPAGEVRKGVGE